MCVCGDRGTIGRWQVWESGPHPHACVPVPMLLCSPVICSLPSSCLQLFLPGICSSTLQLFAVAPRLFAGLILRSVQSPPQLFAATTLGS